jgi:hypothetical protein
MTEITTLEMLCARYLAAREFELDEATKATRQALEIGPARARN